MSQKTVKGYLWFENMLFYQMKEHEKMQPILVDVEEGVEDIMHLVRDFNSVFNSFTNVTKIEKALLTSLVYFTKYWGPNIFFILVILGFMIDKT